jgi:hypothetical protein
MAADGIVDSPHDIVSVTIPAKYVQRFRDETLSALGSAAQAIEEIARWTSEKKERGEESKHEITALDLQKYRDAETLFVEAHADTDGDLTVEARAAVLHSAAIGCTLDVAQAISDEADNREPDFAPVLGEFEFFRELRERLDTEGGRS